MAYLECSDSWDHLEVWVGWILVRNKVAVTVVINVLLRNLVPHDDGVRHSADDGSCHHLEVVFVLLFVVPRVPLMEVAILADFDNKGWISHLWCFILFRISNKFQKIIRQGIYSL